MHVTEWKLFEGDPPEFTTPQWYLDRERAPHLEQDDHGERLRRTAEFVTDAARAHPGGVVDLGCGDGGLLSLLPPGIMAWGYDLCPANVAAARDERGVQARYLDVVTEPDRVEWAPVAVLTEMLEHLADPHGFLREVAGHCQAVVASSPAFETPDLHYEFHAWAWDTDGYAALMAQAGLRVTRHEVVRGFQVLAAVREELA